MNLYEDFNLLAPGFHDRSVWGPYRSERYGNSDPDNGVYIHHTVSGNHFKTDPAAPAPAAHDGVLWHGKKKPGWFTKLAILRRHGLDKWNQMDVRKRGGAKGYVVVKVGSRSAKGYKSRVAKWKAQVEQNIAEEKSHMRFLESIGDRRFGHGISYSEVLFPSGRSYGGNQSGTNRWNQGTHTRGHNTAYAIALVGNYNVMKVTSPQKIYLKQRVKGLDPPYVCPHREVYATACPGDDMVDIGEDLFGDLWSV